LDAAADGNVTTAYVAANPPAPGDALQATLSAPRPLDAVAVLQDPAAPSAGEVELKASDGTWRSIGSLTGGYTAVNAGGATTGAIRIAWSTGTPAPHVYEIVPWYADTPPANLAITPSTVDLEAGGDRANVTVRLAADRMQDMTGTLGVAAPTGWQIQPASAATTVYRGTDQSVDVSMAVPAGAATTDYDLPVTFSATDGSTASSVITVHVHPRTLSTNIAPTGTATASCVEGDGAYPQFDPKYAIDGDLSTRWSSCYDDNAWLQVQLPAPATIGKVVLHWEAAYGKAYKIETSTDGVMWTTAAAVTNGDGGTDIVYLDGAPSAAYVRMQGAARATQYGFSMYELQVYPTA